MRTEELRAELRAMADEIEPFEPDVVAVHRKVRRRHSFVAVAAALALMTGAAALATAWNRGGDKVRVAGTEKLVGPEKLRFLDVIVVPASDDVQQILEASPLVRRYTRVPRGSRQWSLPPGDDLSCALQRSNGFAVESTTPGTSIRNDLAVALGIGASVYDVSYGIDADVEVFMKVGATAEQIKRVAGVVASDQAVQSVRFVDRAAALAFFRQAFADQPDLLRSTKAADLPESFRLVLADRRAASVLRVRFGQLAGVDTVITKESPELALIPATNNVEPEVFMKLGATSPQVESVRIALEGDPDIASVRFLDHDAAYAEFKRAFAEQPELIQSTKPSDLPVSFRVTLLDQRKTQEVKARYRHWPGVDTINAAGTEPLSCTTP
jgi:cell division protein FtsX